MEGHLEVEAAQQPAQQPAAKLEKQVIDYVHPSQKTKLRKKHLAKLEKMTSKFETEHPEDVIIFDHHYPGMACTPEAEALREYRESQKREIDCWANDPSALGDYTDIFDLRYLYDDEEIKLDRAFYLEQEEENPRPYWWSPEPSEVDYYLDLKSRAREATKVEQREDFEYEDIHELDADEQVERVELWVDDGDLEWNNVRFIDGLGFVSDEYDCGYDEPNDLSEPYPKVEGEKFLDICDIKQKMKKYAERVHRGTIQRNIKDSEDLPRQWRRRVPPKIVIRSNWAD